MLASIKQLLYKSDTLPIEKEVKEAYNLWSESYDDQPGNLMLDLDRQLLTSLLENIELKDKIVADFGCGTGRHWSWLYDKNPACLIGLDLSEGMLKKLNQKFPDAITHLISDNGIQMLSDSSMDCLLSTLTLAHIKNIEDVIGAWSRVLKEGGYMLVTDFHPVMLEKGGRRSFTYHNQTHAVVNHIHPIASLRKICCANNLFPIKFQERWVDESVKSYYLDQGALSVFERFNGTPIIYGLLLIKRRVAE